MFRVDVSSTGEVMMSSVKEVELRMKILMKGSFASMQEARGMVTVSVVLLRPMLSQGTAGDTASVLQGGEMTLHQAHSVLTPEIATA